MPQSIRPRSAGARTRAIAAAATAALAVSGIAVLAVAPAQAATETITVGHNDTTTTQGTLNKVFYTGSWDHNANFAWQTGTTPAADQAFEIKFVGEEVKIYGGKRTTNGQGTIFIDGVEVGIMDSTATSNSSSVFLLNTLSGLEAGEHTLKVVANGAVFINFARAEFTATTADPDPDPGTPVVDGLSELYDSLQGKTASDYSTGSWAGFQTAMTAAADIMADPDATPEAREVVRAQLAQAVADLVVVKGLRQLTTDYQTRVPTDFVSGSWPDFAAALTAAQSVVDAAAPTASAVVAAKNTLLAAASQLVSASTGSLETIQNNVFWRDTDGNLIYSQGGGIFRFGDTYYWYGVRYPGADSYYASPTKTYANTATDVKFMAITCYSSKDLVNWKFENNVATTSTALNIPHEKDRVSDYFSRMKSLDDASWLGRLGVTYNENTGKFVIVTQMESKFAPDNATNHSVLFLTGDSPTDNFEYANVQLNITNMAMQGTGDQTVFTDDDGTSYLVFSNQSGRGNAYVAKIAEADSLSIEPAVLVRSGSGREGNCMFKANDRYYMATSELFGWNASHAWMIRSQTDNPLGAYTSEWKLAGTEKDYSHTTQTGFFFTVKGTEQDTIVFAGDRWSDFAWNGLGYNQWMPITMEGDTPVFHSLSQWKINAVTGRWEVGAGNNYILNGDFQADRVNVTTIVGWTTVVDAGSATGFVTNNTAGVNSSRFAGRLSRTGAFSGSIYQENAIPAGLYSLGTWATTTGGLDYARIRVTSAVGEEYVLDLSGATTSWQKFALSGIVLSGPTARISIEAKNSSGTRNLTVDQLELVRQGDIPLNLTAVASNRCVAGKAILTVQVTNNDTVPASLTVSSPFGDKEFASVAPGKNAAAAFTTRLTSVAAGQVSVSGIGLVEDGDAPVADLTASYAAAVCG